MILVSKKEKRKQEVEESASSSSAEESSSEEEASSSEEEEASDSEVSSDNEAPAAAKKDAKKKEKKAAESDNEDESSDSDSSDAESEKADGSSSDSGSGSDSESDADEDESDSSGGKRKAGSDVEMEDTEATAKKPKTEEEGAKVHSVFVGNLAFATTDESLATAFGAFGEVVAARVAMQPNSGRSRGFGYVDFASADAQQKAMEATDFEVDGRAVRMDKTDGHAGDSKHAAQRSGSSSEPSKVLFIGNMSFRSTEDSVRQAFEECGTVVSVRIITDRETGRAKGYGYVEFDSVEAAASAMEWNGSDLDGRNIRLDYSTPRQGGNGGGSGGSFRGGRGGFRGGRGGGRGRGGSRY
ncbi:nuclear localization sequence binding protein [Coemansia sp. Benny D160-2]|nr:nuclear localization sequence binding protein [Coemansia sp. Benny D160-2]